MTKPALRIVVLSSLLFACDQHPPLELSEVEIVDLTYTFNQETLYWPTSGPFQHDRTAWGRTEGGYWYSSYQYSANEHGGTHLDAPIHFAEGKSGVAEIPVQRLIGPAHVVDISAKCKQDSDYLLSPQDIRAHEESYGAIAPAEIVLVRTGWGSRWPQAKDYLGSDVSGDVENLHFPGISEDAAGLLAERGVAAVGIDTASIDHGPSRNFVAHQVLAQASIPCLENVANMSSLPPTGSTVFALPMKIGHGSGAPVRIVALIPH